MCNFGGQSGILSGGFSDWVIGTEATMEIEGNIWRLSRKCDSQAGGDLLSKSVLFIAVLFLRKWTPLCFKTLGEIT